MKKKQQNIQNLDRFRMKFWDGQFMYEVININVKDDYALVAYLHDDDLPYEEVKLSNGILLQCTGLTDKNGKLIYESDIIQHTLIHEDGTEEIEDCNFTQIQFRDATFCFVGNVGTKDEYCESLFFDWGGKWQPEFAVIGNIYQNPELLNTVK